MILFILVFYWTPPHFWALALLKQADYACAGVPMLPIIAGEKEARWQILLYSILMVCLSFLLTPLQGAGLLYLALALGSGTLFIIFAWQVWASEAQRNVWQLYSYSMFYIAFLFSAMILDRTMGY
jgi:protoheme IX farnesyltransferase